MLEGGDAKARERKAPKKTLHEETIQLLREENERLERDLRLLRARVLTHDKKEAVRAREVRAATEDADVLFEAVSLLAQVVTNTRREERDMRERVRKLLEEHKIPPPSTLGSSRNRKKAGSRRPKTTETS